MRKTAVDRGIRITKAQLDLEKGRSHSIVLARAKDIFLDTKKYPKKRNKKLLSNGISRIHSTRTKRFESIQ